MRSAIAALLALLLALPVAASAQEDEPEESTGDPEEGDESPPEDQQPTEADLDERVRQLEQELRLLKDMLEIQAELAAEAASAPPPQPAPRPSPAAVLSNLNPDIALIADVALAWVSSDEPLQSGGHDPSITGFNLQQVELSVSKAVDPYFEFDANIVFSQFGVEIEEAYATTLGLPIGLQLRIGQFLTRFGRVNATHPHTWDFVDQALPVGRVFGGEGNRGLGLEASILMPFPWYFELIASETMAGGAATARSFFGGNDLGVKTPIDLQTTVAIEQFFPLGADHSLAWGLSWASGPNPTGRRNRTEVYGSDLYYTWRPVRRGGVAEVSLTAEVFWRRQQTPGDVLQDVSLYGQLFWRFARRWAVAGRYEFGSPTTNMTGERVADPQDPDWTLARHRAALAATFWPTEFSRVRLQGSSDFARWREQPDWAVVLAFEFSVGAHGAHAF